MQATHSIDSGDGLSPHRNAQQRHVHISSVGEYIVIFLALMILLALTVAAAYVDLKAGNIVVMYFIALVKGVLIVAFFMHVRHASRLTWIFSAAAFLWLSIMFVFMFNDYLTRPVNGLATHNSPAIRADRIGDLTVENPARPSEKEEP